MKRTAVLAVAALIAGSAAVLTVTSPAAAAYYPTCDTAIGVGTALGEASVPATTDGNFDCVMGQGAESAAVVALQQGINCSGANTSVDGNFGPDTARKLRSIQRRAGIRQDGIYGPQTREYMAFEISGVGCYPVAV